MFGKVRHRIVVAAAVAALAWTAPAFAPAFAQELKQMQLTDKQVADFIAAQKDFQPLATKLLEAGDKPSDALIAELETISKKHNFANFAEFEDVGANISLVLEGLDRKTGTYTDPVEKMKTELEDIKADKSIPEEDKKLAIDDLTQDIAAAEPLKHMENIEVVKKHQTEIEKLMPEETGDSPAAGTTDEGAAEGAAPEAADPAAAPAPAPAAPDAAPAPKP